MRQVNANNILYRESIISNRRKQRQSIAAVCGFFSQAPQLVALDTERPGFFTIFSAAVDNYIIEVREMVGF